MFVVGLSSLIIILSQLNLGWTAIDYCSITSCSKKGPHTMCLYPSSTPAARCGEYIKVPLTQNEINTILKQHNEWRQKVATGSETRGNPGPQPPAKNMPPLEWDNELARIAQRYADQCISGHDKCKDVERFGVGQNIATSWGDASVNNPTVLELMQGWYNEVSRFNKNYVPKYVFNVAWGHYSALVWAKTACVGCGRVRYTVNGTTYVRLICNYGPGGNVIGQSVYQT